MERDKIKHLLYEYINENKTYDSVVDLKQWYDDETKKNDNIKDFKRWKLKTQLLQKQYMEKKTELLTKNKDPYALKGNSKVNYIYHYTNGEALIDIIENNILIGGGDSYGGISFTSHPNLYKRGFVFWYPNKYTEGKHHENIGIKIKFDFNKMKKDGLEFILGNEDIGTHSGEEEIRIKSDEIKNILNYVVDIIIFKNKEKDYSKIIELLNKKNIKHKVI